MDAVHCNQASSEHQLLFIFHCLLCTLPIARAVETRSNCCSCLHRSFRSVSARSRRVRRRIFIEVDDAGSHAEETLAPVARGAPSLQVHKRIALAPLHHSHTRRLVHAVLGAASGNAHGVASLLFDGGQVEAAVSTVSDVEDFAQFHPALQHRALVVRFSHRVCGRLSEVDATASDAARSGLKSALFDALSVLLRCAVVKLPAPFHSVSDAGPQLLHFFFDGFAK